ncbi:MAG: hypothetical protein J6D06_00375 [Clostridia bacterium]|nr:hypothetical protein [Clostridia bacterium]
MKKICSLILIIAVVLSSFSVSAVAASIATPTTWASNDTVGIKVSWTAVSNAKKYNVYRRAAGSSSWIYLDTTTANVYLDDTVYNGNYYAYSVRAYDSAGNYSAYDKAKTYSVKCVATPVLTSIKNVTAGIQINWGAVARGCVYRVYRRGAGSSSWLYLGNTTGTSFVDSKATSGAYWRYTVRAVSSGFYSGFDTAGLYTMRLANPYSIKAVSYDNHVYLSWAKINGATNYRVYRRGAGETYWTYLGSVDTNYCYDYSVKMDKYYRYTVRAARGNIFSDFYTNGPVVICKSDISRHLPIEMYFSSGAGGWGTVVEITKDCKFSGNFHDSNMGDTGYGYPNGTVYVCRFNGSFTNVRKINNYTYAMNLASLYYTEEPGYTWYEDGRRYISTGAYGIEDGDAFCLYTPDTPVNTLPQDVLDWGSWQIDDDSYYLGCYCLYNISQGLAFFS